MVKTKKAAAFFAPEKLDDSSQKTIKEQLPFCTNSDALKYGNFYLKCWKSADDNSKKEMENYLQDLVHYAVFGKPLVAQKIRKVLCPFVNQKRSKVVDSLLFRLLEPIIWTGLNAPNYNVRLNSVEMFLFAFPMNDAVSNVQQNYLQRQMEILPTLVTDIVPSIRSSAVIGICKICDLYWDIIPVDVLQSLFVTFVDRLAVDASSVNVRVAVIKGLVVILNNPASYNVLEKILPRIQLCLHDNSELVRIAFVQLLHKIKELKLKTLKYWNIVSMDHILARLSGEKSGRIQKSITYLIQNSFCPENATAEDRLQRVITLIDKHMQAARKYFVHAPEAIPSFDLSIEYILLMLRCVYSCVRQKKGEFEEKDAAGHVLSEVGKDADSDPKDFPCAENLTADNLPVMCGLLECGAIIWNSIGHRLVQPENSDTHKRLVKISSKIVQECFIFFDDIRINDVLLYYASLLPASAAPYLATSAVKKLQNIEDVADIGTENFGSLLEAVCFWRFKDIADSIVIWLDFCGDLERSVSTVYPRTPVPKRNRQVKFASKRNVSKPEPKPRLALTYLEFLLTNTQCRHYLLASANRVQLKRLADKLDKFVTRCWESSRYEERFSDTIGLKEILLADRLSFSLQMLLTSKKVNENASTVDETVSFFTKKMSYHEINTLELLSDSNVNAKSNTCSMLLQFFTHCQHLLMLNMASDIFVETFCLFLHKIVADFGIKNIRLFSNVSAALYSVVDYLHNCANTAVKFDPIIRNLLEIWLNKFLVVFSVTETEDLLIYHKTVLASGYEAAKQALVVLIEEHKNEQTEHILKNYLQQLTDVCGHLTDD